MTTVYNIQICNKGIKMHVCKKGVVTEENLLKLGLFQAQPKKGFFYLLLWNLC